MQMAVIEYARNVLGLQGANSEEADHKTKYPVIHLMEQQKALIRKKLFGGTIRLGAWPCLVKNSTQLSNAYVKFGNSLFESLPTVQERHRHRYEVNNDYRQQLERAGLVISGTSPDDLLVEAVELPKTAHPFFVGTQYHPELKSHFLEPHPLFMAFVKAILSKD
jgi:CTP synthase